MIIRKMTATFGRLENETLTFTEGLNIITAPNESGKSTWCAFIRAMLYGIDSSQRERGGQKPDKLKYAPISGASMRGEMEIEHEGKSITLLRETRTATSPLKIFKAVYTGTNTDVPNLTAADVGLVLTGMSREVFDRSVFMRQSGLSVENVPELERRINSIISSGEEGCSHTEADNFLQKHLRRRRHNKTGAIPARSSEIAAIDETIAALKSDAQRKAALELSLSEKIRENASIAKTQHEERQSESAEALRSLEEQRNRKRQSEEKYFSARESAAAIAAKVQSSPFGEATAEDVLADFQKTLAAKPKKSAKFNLAPVNAALAAAFFALGNLSNTLFYIAGAVFLALAIVLLFFMLREKKQNAQWPRTLKEKYGTADIPEIKTLIERHTAALKAKDEASAALKSAATELEAAEQNLKAAEKKLFDQADSEKSPAAPPAAAEIEALRREIAMIDGKFSSLGDPMVLSSQRSELEARRDAAQAQYDAIALAIEKLSDANLEIQTKFSPRLGELASQYMAKLTDGRYEKLSFDRSFNSAAKLRSGQNFDAGFLSAGTLDALYLSLRLSICALALPEGYNCPMVLDDVLCSFDEPRARKALDCFLETAKERQVILFSCHSREAHYLENKI